MLPKIDDQAAWHRATREFLGSPAFNALKRPVKVESSNMFAHRVSSHTPSTWKYWEHTAQYSSILPVENGPIDRHASSLSFDEAGAANLGYAIIA
jgi:hypothetical protein